jgi:hypothetical protein
VNRIAIAIIALTLGFRSFSATTYYCSPTGLGANNGLTTGTPWNIATGVDALTNGNTIILMDGSYASTQVTIREGRANATLKAQNKWAAILPSSSGMGIAMAYPPFCHDLVIDGLCITNSTLEAIGMSGYNNTITNCWLRDSSSVEINCSHPEGSNNIIDHCLVELAGHGVYDGIVGHRWHGIYISGQGSIVRNNVVRCNAGYGIHYYGGYVPEYQYNSQFYNNLVYGHTNFYGITIWSGQDDGSGGNAGTNWFYGNTILDGMDLSWGSVGITNNIILPSLTFPTGGIRVSGARPATVYSDYNVGTNSFGTYAGPHDVITTYAGLKFVNPAAGLYWIQSSSAAKNVAIGSVFGSMDFFGNPQASVSSIGAFQYSSILSGDTRVLQPSPVYGANYWASLGVVAAGMSVGTSINMSVQSTVQMSVGSPP